eukprot:Sspe_Gene.47207::Locus_23893_Transcript_1_1_Confidence_1.000_Length_1737::g.47207::m.47207
MPMHCTALAVLVAISGAAGVTCWASSKYQAMLDEYSDTSCAGTKKCRNTVAFPSFFSNYEYAARNLKEKYTDKRRRCESQSCVPLRRDGEACTVDDECESSICFSSKCTLPRSVPPESACTDDRLCRDGYCKNGRCKEWGRVGSVCTPDTAERTVRFWPSSERLNVFRDTGRCFPGLVSNQQTWAIRHGLDPEFDIEALPLKCKVSKAVNSGTVGECVGYVESGGDCIAQQTADDVFPGNQVNTLLEDDYFRGYLPTPCERGKYPRMGSTPETCSCETFVGEGDECRYVASANGLVALDRCVYGHHCALLTNPPTISNRTIVKGTCIELRSLKAGQHVYAASGEASLLPPEYYCKRGLYYDTEKKQCTAPPKWGQTCRSDADCEVLDLTLNTQPLICNIKCGATEGRCMSPYDYCGDVYLDNLKFEADMQLRSEIGYKRFRSLWGSYTGSLKSLLKRFDLAQKWLCCLNSEVPKQSTMWVYMGLHEVDIDALGTCDEEFDVAVVVVTSIIGAGVLGVMILIIVKDMLPSMKQAKGD